MNFSVNNFGFLPINPDTLLESPAIGQGSERPLGFSFSEIFNFYWTVKSFSIYAGLTIHNTPNFGGTSLVELLNSIANSNIGQKSSYEILGNTTISSSFHQELRSGTRTEGGKFNNKPIDLFTFEGVVKNQLQQTARRKTKIELSEASKKRITNYNLTNSSVNEGSLLSAGPIHSLKAGGGGVTIDFSSIVLKNSLYYPRIIINFGVASSLSSTESSITLGGINCLGGVIQIFANMSLLNNPLIVLSSGSISIGKRKQDRFYYDNKDKEREKL